MTRPSGVAITTPQPPGPGFPLAAPSQKTTIENGNSLIGMNVTGLVGGPYESGRRGADVCRRQVLHMADDPQPTPTHTKLARLQDRLDAMESEAKKEEQGWVGRF